MKPTTTLQSSPLPLTVRFAAHVKNHLVLILGLFAAFGLVMLLYGKIENGLSRRDAAAEQVQSVSARLNIVGQRQQERLAFVRAMRDQTMIHPFARQDDVLRQLREDLGLVLGQVRIDITAVPGRFMNGSGTSLEPTSAGIVLLPVKLRMTASEAGLFGWLKSVEDLRPGILIETLSIRPAPTRGQPRSQDDPSIEITMDAVLLVEAQGKTGSP